MTTVLRTPTPAPNFPAYRAIEVIDLVDDDDEQNFLPRAGPSTAGALPVPPPRIPSDVIVINSDDEDDSEVEIINVHRAQGPDGPGPHAPASVNAPGERIAASQCRRWLNVLQHLDVALSSLLRPRGRMTLYLRSRLFPITCLAMAFYNGARHAPTITA